MPKRTKSSAAIKKPKTESDSKLDEELEIYEKFFFEKFATELGDKGLRHDGRRFDEERQRIIKSGVLNKTLGSAYVAWGEAKVLVGVKGCFVPPCGPDSNEGKLEVRCTIADTAYEGVGDDILQTRDQSNTVAEFVSLMINTSQTIDLKSLCCNEDFAWILHLDIYILSYSGSIKDACLAAAITALINTTIPDTEVVDEVPVVVPNSGKKLEISRYPISSTIGKFKNHLLIDLSQTEEAHSSIINIVHDSTGRLLNVSKSSGPPVSADALRTAIEMSRNATKKIKQEIESEAVTGSKKKALF
eukprot:TRINITY_DN19411_c0_g1_i1.p1 TRINITY_DN19411_c0_g1~~TRINITY_DN19411_c0_g1_i1.p1  ORF type:complete len:302 (+),score=46.91 TRINITY_DN19411_c0_g1_i1:63-968(+)